MQQSFIVAVGTRNGAKLGAVTIVFQSVFPTAQCLGYEVASGIIVQPMDDETSIRGATNRARGALQLEPKADFGVGMEGNVATTADHMFLRGWVVIIDRRGKIGIGHSGGIEVPEHIAERLRSGEELGPLMQAMLSDKDDAVRHGLGANGVLSGGLYTRMNEFVHATQCALAPFARPELYP